MIAAAVAFLATAPDPEPLRAATSRGGTLPDELARIVRSQPLASARTSALVLDAASGETLFSHDPGMLLKPASNMKILTAAAALALLRPEYRFRTTFYTSAPPDPSGEVRGDLYIKGGGSPGLVGERLWMAARRLRALGIRKVEGDLVGDDTFFDDRRRAARWPSPDVDRPYNAPVSALSVAYNAVAVTVRPTAEGEPPGVYLEPFDSYFRIVNRAVTSGHGRRIRVSRRFDNGQNVILVEGRIGPYAEPVTTYKSVEQPTLYALAAFREVAAKEGIEIAGASRRGVVPPAALVVHVQESRPLTELIHDMNKMSLNFVAELVLKTIGAEIGGVPGSVEKGAAAVTAYLEDLGVKTEGLVIADGSGLSPDNRLSAEVLARVLVAMHRDFHAAPEFMASLPVGGIDGTLDRRLSDGPATRNVRAKTGRINGVTTLSGYAWNKEGRLLVFSILVNGFGKQEWEANQLLDRFCDALVSKPIPTGANRTAAKAAQGG